MIVSLIVAVSKNGVIGKSGKIPWRISVDLQRFKKLTMGCHIIMGRKTFESIGHPLEGRFSIILSKQISYQQEGCQIFDTLEKALAYCDSNHKKEKGEDEVFIIGGENIFKEALLSNFVDRVYMTRLHKNYEGDTYFSDFDESEFNLIRREDHETYSFINYTNKKATGLKKKSQTDRSLAIDSMVYFIYEEDLYIGKIVKQIENDTWEVLTYVQKEMRLKLPRSALHLSIKEGDQHFKKMCPEAELDVDKLIDTARFLQSFIFGQSND